ncbi:hypothetical protein Daus18300_001735 [Diaporthe australafricana]|uniref:Uncharacterized protein n=1 Tax=Diaporthe australafricana TaxID=127596 RepID=A0ABR3XT50_9PEZI
MAALNDLATELQIAIWQFVLPYRGIHWVEIEGIAHDAPYVRDSIRFTRHSYPDGELPEGRSADIRSLKKCAEQEARYMASREPDGHRFLRCPGLFFQKLLPVVPSVWGAAGPGDDHGDGEITEQLAEEIAYTRRCRQLSTYTQVTALLETCRLSRDIALEYIEKYSPYLWNIYRSKGLLHRPRPLHVWEAQYRNENNNGPDYGPYHTSLVPMIRSPLDLVVLRLHDSHGRATPMLRQASFQFLPETSAENPNVFPWLDRIGIEWHPRWADERDHFRAANVEAVTNLMDWRSYDSSMLYWLVDGVPRPNWKRDYPSFVPAAFKVWMRRFYWKIHKFQVNMDKETKAAFLADCDLDLEFEANGRRYFLVMVVIPWKRYGNVGVEVEPGIDGPFVGGEAIWPEKLRSPARFAYDILDDLDLWSLHTLPLMSFILSWEPI